MGRAKRAAFVAALVIAGAAGSARAQDTAETSTDAEEAEAADAEVRADGDREYEGVVPGESARPPGAPWRSRRWTPVYWIGFQPAEGRLFVQLGRELDYQQRVTDAGELIVFLPKARLANQNAARPLVTRYFDTAVAQVDARRVPRRRGRAAGVELRVSFKDEGAAAEAAASLRREDDGYHYLYLSF